MSSNQRFSFDDNEDVSKSNTTPLSNKTLEKNNVDGGAKPMKKKKKSKIKKWQVFVIGLLLIVIAFVAYVFIAGENDGPVYGDRCASLLAIDESKFTSVADTIKADGNINTVNIEVDCRIVKISINFVDNTPSATAISLATNALHTLDDTLGQPKQEGSSYSSMFGTDNGRGQYNVEFVLTSNGDTNFPLFGTKHPNSDEISFTGANAVNQAATDKALGTTTGQ